MKIVLPIWFLVVLASMLCRLQQSMAQSAPAESTPARTTVLLKNYPAVSGLAEIGTHTNESIRVIVYGRVNRPGIYYLPPGSTVRVAIENAGGLDRLAMWYVSCVLRPIDTTQAEEYKFSRRHEQADLEFSLKEGDRLCLLVAY